MSKINNKTTNILNIIINKWEKSVKTFAETKGRKRIKGIKRDKGIKKCVLHKKLILVLYFHKIFILLWKIIMIMRKAFEPDGDYNNLMAFKKADAIYQCTYDFINRFISKSDRTFDQMLQAARSGKQNIAEGNVDGAASKISKMKLLGFASGSLAELKTDYIDYLKTRNLILWNEDDPKHKQTRYYCSHRNDSHYYREALQQRSDETCANILIILIFQCKFLVDSLIRSSKRDFVTSGGNRENLQKERKKYKASQHQAEEPEVEYGLDLPF